MLIITLVTHFPGISHDICLLNCEILHVWYSINVSSMRGHCCSVAGKTIACSTSILYRYLVQLTIFHFLPSFLLTHLGRQWKMAHVLGPCSFMEQQKKLLAAAFQPDPAADTAVILRVKEQRWKIFFPLPLCNSNFQINQLIFYFSSINILLNRIYGWKVDKFSEEIPTPKIKEKNLIRLVI